ncbi:unnamed protein product [Hymenolepis diminuta]|uniref:KH domain-containing protein n=1 Tax=Hymenolepis diminuta TaxID=6216 RepID=A0A0R3SUC7_HYMDI|nr:unnamed protein product [Hymenolepis diminuta]
MCPSGVDCEVVMPTESIGRKFKQEDLGEKATNRGSYAPDKPVSLRFLMSRREAGCLIGKSGAKIKVSDKGVKERIVSVSGSIAAILRVIKQFCREFAWITGSLVKITRQRLPNSTERILFIYGTVTAITACLEMICALLGEKRNVLNDILPNPETAQPNTTPENRSLLPSSAVNSPTSSSASQRTQLYPSVVFPANCYCPASLINSILAAFHFAEDVVRRDMLIANNLIGCVIGRGGVKINEIRKASQATIRISNDENSLQQQHCSRLITITGSPKAVDSAVDMINASLQCREATLMPSEITQPIF